MERIWDIGKKVAFGSAVLVAVPVALPCLFVLSITAAALSVPVASTAVGYYALKKVLGFGKTRLLGWHSDPDHDENEATFYQHEARRPKVAEDLMPPSSAVSLPGKDECEIVPVSQEPIIYDQHDGYDDRDMVEGSSQVGLCDPPSAPRPEDAQWEQVGAEGAPEVCEQKAASEMVQKNVCEQPQSDSDVFLGSQNVEAGEYQQAELVDKREAQKEQAPSEEVHILEEGKREGQWQADADAEGEKPTQVEQQPEASSSAEHRAQEEDEVHEDDQGELAGPHDAGKQRLASEVAGLPSQDEEKVPREESMQMHLEHGGEQQSQSVASEAEEKEPGAEQFSVAPAEQLKPEAEELKFEAEEKEDGAEQLRPEAEEKKFGAEELKPEAQEKEIGAQELPEAEEKEPQLKLAAEEKEHGAQELPEAEEKEPQLKLAAEEKEHGAQELPEAEEKEPQLKLAAEEKEHGAEELKPEAEEKEPELEPEAEEKEPGAEELQPLLVPEAVEAEEKGDCRAPDHRHEEHDLVQRLEPEADDIHDDDLEPKLERTGDSEQTLEPEAGADMHHMEHGAHGGQAVVVEPEEDHQPAGQEPAVVKLEAPKPAAVESEAGAEQDISGYHRLEATSSIDDYASVAEEFPEDGVSSSDEAASRRFHSQEPSRTSSARSEDSLLREILTVQKVVGYKDDLRDSPADEVERLYDFLGVEMPTAYENTTDPRKLLESLDLLKAIVGVK